MGGRIGNRLFIGGLGHRTRARDRLAIDQLELAETGPDPEEFCSRQRKEALDGSSLLFRVMDL